MANFSVDLNPITVEIEIKDGDPQGGDEGRYVVYLHDERVKEGEWVNYPYTSLDTDAIRLEYTQLYEQFQVKRFKEYLSLDG